MASVTRESGERSRGLLQRGDPEPLAVTNGRARSPFVIVCDHAGRAVPQGLSLGVAAAEMDRHIAWDIGAGDLSLALGERLDATVVRQPYSRLVIDCNRNPARADAMPEVSDGTVVPANVCLSAEGRAERVAEIHAPYHDGLDRLLDERAAAGLRTVLVLMHSFTPVMNSVPRPWRFGVLHTGQPIALAVLRRLREAKVGEVGDNQPYAMDEVDYTAGRHGTERGLDFVEIEVRQDLIADQEGRRPVVDLLADLLPAALADVDQA